MQKQKNPWCTHQPTPCIPGKNEKQYCAYKQCPGLKVDNKRKRPYTSTMKCEECSVMNDKETYFCMTIENENGTKKVRNCHYKHHRINFPNPNNII